MLNKDYKGLGVAVAIGKHYPEVNDKEENTTIKDDSAVSWIAFGIQVLAL